MSLHDSAIPNDTTMGSVPQRLLGPTGLGTASLPITPPTPGVPGTGENSEGIPRPTGGISRIPSGPTGIGTASTRVHTIRTTVPDTQITPPEPRPPFGDSTIGESAVRMPISQTGPASLFAASPDSAPAPPGRPSGAPGTGAPKSDSQIPDLHCPPPVRDDPALAEAVNQRLLLWAQSIGLFEGRMEVLQEADFGRLIMLAHPESDDPDRLLAAAKCAVAEWALDDYYCGEEAADRAPGGTASNAEAEVGPRLELAAAAIDPAQLPAPYQAQLERVMAGDPVLRAGRTALEHLAHYATPAQMGRLRSEITAWFTALTAEAGWRAADRMPPVWEYLTNRQPNSFIPCMALVDVVGGYELSATEYTDPRVRRAVTTAALASQMVNDLYSMAREDKSEGREFNLPTVLEAEQQCSRREAVRQTAAIHDELMHRFESEAAVLAATGTPALGRFLGGLHAWLGGSRAWHAGSHRYNESS